MADLLLKDLVKRYNPNDAPVVNNVSLSVGPGELVSFLGPSGCGKTTILRMIAGLLLPDKGEIQIKGEEVANLPPYKRDIGMVFQNYALFPHLTVSENVAFGLKMRKVKLSKAQMMDQIESALKMVDLAGYGERYPKNLSGGQQQRVALARALVLKPAVLLLDEPLSALDAKLRLETREEIRRLQQELGLATVFVTHDQDEALSISDKVAVLNHGVIQQFDKPQLLYEHPINEFVAKFMGVSNIFSIEKDMGNGRYKTKEGLLISGESSGAEYSAVGVRPEMVQLESGEADTQSINHFTGTVQKRSYNGTLVKVVVELQNGTVIHSMIPSNKKVANVSIGEKVTAYWNLIDTLLLLPERK